MNRSLTESENAGSLTLRSRLNFSPQELKFGTSGRRGLVADLTQLEIYINVLGELQYLQCLPAPRGGIRAGDSFYVGTDLRPSSTQFVPEQQNRGELVQAVLQAVSDAGMHPVFLGPIPTPALTAYALERRCGSIMVTGSHIPFDRNGYKTNTSIGELLKEHENPIAGSVQRARERVYQLPFNESQFDESGMFKGGHRDLPAVTGGAEDAYVEHYLNFFGRGKLAGKRVLVYQHSAVGRDLLVRILREMGADAIPAGRSAHFVPIDTENIDAPQLRLIQSLADQAVRDHGTLDAVVSVDGDSDRPLILGMESSGRLRFFGGDLVGMVVAEYLNADAVVVPISCNDAVDRGALGPKLEQKTRIGSPFVIAGIEAAKAKGRQTVCGWEANGGFLLGSDLTRDGRTLPALPTRDAVLPILCTLLSAAEKGLTVSELFARLPKRFSRAALIKNFPRPVSAKIVAKFSPPDPKVRETDAQTGAEWVGALRPFFAAESGFGAITKINYVDGVRITFENGDVVHFRPSGNADELRAYAVADTQARADEICALAVAEPEGILRRFEAAVTS
jgi:phosphomannomutase